MRRLIIKLLSIAGVGTILLSPGISAAAVTSSTNTSNTTNNSGTTVTVTPANNDGWATADTNGGGMVQFVYDPSSPLPDGALQLTTDTTATAKAQYIHTASRALSDVKTLSYQTMQFTANSQSGDPSYQLVVCLAGLANNTCNGYTNLVYEPYWNGTVTPKAWQNWDVASGKLWSSRSYTDATNTNCTVTAGGGGQPFYTIADLSSACPNAQVVGFGVNVGSNNPNYVVEVDQVVFNTYTYDFELTNAPTNKNDCKDGGYNKLTNASGDSFKNQGACVSYANQNNDNQHMSMAAVQVNNKNNSAAYNASR